MSATRRNGALRPPLSAPSCCRGSAQPTVECRVAESNERRDALHHLDEALTDHRAGPATRGGPRTHHRELERTEADVPGKPAQVAAGPLRVALEQLVASRESLEHRHGADREGVGASVTVIGLGPVDVEQPE